MPNSCLVVLKPRCKHVKHSLQYQVTLRRAWSVSPTSQEASADTSWQSGTSLHSNGDHPSAAMAYHNSCKMVPNDFKSNYGLETRAASGNAKPAIQTFYGFLQCLSLYPHSLAQRSVVSRNRLLVLSEFRVLPLELAPHSPKVNINKTTRSQALGLKDSALHQVRLTGLYWCRSMLTSQNSDVNNQVLKARDSFILSSNYPHVLPRSLRNLNDEGQWERI